MAGNAGDFELCFENDRLYLNQWTAVMGEPQPNGDNGAVQHQVGIAYSQIDLTAHIENIVRRVVTETER